MEANVYLNVNTLIYDPDACINCGMCSIVCPHGVFISGEKNARLVYPGRCMECGACMKNCPTRAIWVDAGVGCAAAMINAALKGQKEPTCGCGPDDPGSACCG